GCSLDSLHIGIGEAKMMADLVHQNMLDDGAERFVVLSPIIENRPPIEPDHIRHLPGRAFRTKRQADALEEAEQFEFAFRFHLLEHVLAWKIVDANDDIGGEIANRLGKCRKTSAAKTSSSASDGALTGRQASGSDLRSAIIAM